MFQMPPKKGTKSKKRTAHVRTRAQKPTPSDVDSTEEETESDDESKILHLLQIGLLLCHSHIELRLIEVVVNLS